MSVPVPKEGNLLFMILFLATGSADILQEDEDAELGLTNYYTSGSLLKEKCEYRMIVLLPDCFVIFCFEDNTIYRYVWYGVCCVFCRL